MWIRNFLTLCLSIALQLGWAWAECKILTPSVMYLGKNENYDLSITVEPDGLCPIFFNAQAGGVSFTSSEILAKPSAGRLAPAGHNDFAYVAPKAAGQDSFKLRLCGIDTAGTGCNVLTYAVQVN